MPCPACNAENPAPATRCGACGAALSPSKRSRRRAVEADADLPAATVALNQAALRAYRFGLLAAIPVLGLVLGPAGLVVSWRAFRHGRADPRFGEIAAARAGLVLSGLSALTNWTGLALIVGGLWQTGWLG
jgi:hypothetical protein